ncbi:DUF4836 family protein [Chitinophaga sp.]|uniref:DUF4836 family protein n=1 Tax=Chitinophaga sp. TaxID=1869181 RepID=UPI0031DA7B79
MTKMFSKVLLTAVTAAVILSACSKVPDQSKYIPKTAGVVLSINSKQITNKLVTNGLTMEKVISILQDKDTANPAMKAWKDAENSGVDLQNNFFVSVVFNNNQQSYVTLTGGLKDAGKFEAYLKKTLPNFSLKKKTDFQYVWEADQDAVIGWNKETVIYIRGVDANKLKNGGIPGGIPGGGFDENEDDSSAVDSAVATQVRYESTDAEATWVAEADHLFHLKKDESAADITAFHDLLKNNADLSVYVNPEPMYASQGSAIPANLKKLLEGSYYTGAINFEKGKVVMDGVSYAGKDLSEIYKKYGKSEADVKLLEQYPSDNILGFMVYGFDFRMIGDIVKATGLDGMANISIRMYSGNQNLTLDDILNAFNGQMFFAASDLNVRKAPSTIVPEDSVTRTDLKWVFAMKVGDKAAFEKVMSIPALQTFVTKKGDKYVLAEMAQQPGMPAVSIDDKLIAVANDQPTLDAYLGGRSKAGGLDNSFVSKINGNPMGAYINFEKISAAIPDNQIPESGKAIASQVKDLLKDATAITHPFDGKTQHSEVVLNFKKQDEHSLVQLVNLGTNVAKIVQEEKKADTSVVY